MKASPLAAAIAAALACPAVHVPAALAQESIGAPVVVTATRQKQRADEVIASIEVIDRETIERAGQSSLVDLLQSLTGVRIATSGGPGANASMFLRGAESRHTLLLVDGLRVGSATSGQATLEAIPLAMVERIEILRGPASALYGSEAIGGVIQIFTRRGREGLHPELFVGIGGYDTVNASASLNGGQGALRYSLSVGQDDSKGYSAKRNRPQWHSSWGSSYHPDRDGFRNRYASASATVDLRERDRFGVHAFATDGRNHYDTNDYYRSYLDKQVDSAGAWLQNELGQGWTSTVRIGQSRDRLHNVTDDTNRNRIRSTQQQFQWQHDVRLPVGSLMAAYEYVRARVGGDTDYVVDKRDVHAFLLGWSGSFDAHSVQLNLRHDDNSQFGSKTTGMFGYGFRISPQWRVHASVATAFNAPTFNQLYWPDTGFGGGNPDLEPEHALNREIGLRWDDGTHHVELTYYNNRVRDLIAGWPPQNLNRARLEGIELAWQANLAGYDLRAGVDVLDAKDERSGNRLPRRAKLAGFARIERIADRWSWGVEWDGQGKRYEDTANTLELAGYGLIHAYAHYRLAPDWRVELRANNLLDKRYELSRGYATAGANLFAGIRYTPR
ncbi:MAG: TonB-dependent receptor [Rhodocyclaceae bacterium]|jgi:vitamin B12 transporter|nr:TonB-dependent receptor [Rhodocyclaceae bacterium]